MFKVNAPFSKEQIEQLNDFQINSPSPFACTNEECIDKEPEDRIFIAMEQGWTCPCRKNVQNWAWLFMTKNIFKLHGK